MIPKDILDILCIYILAFIFLKLIVDLFEDILLAFFINLLLSLLDIFKQVRITRYKVKKKYKHYEMIIFTAWYG